MHRSCELWSAAVCLFCLQGCAPPPKTVEHIDGRSLHLDQLLSNMCAFYARAASYHDTAVVTLSGSDGNVEAAGQSDLSFERPARLRLDWDIADSPSGHRNHGSVEATSATTEVAFGQDHHKNYDNIDAALHSVAGVSYDTSQVVPRLLLGEASFICGPRVDAAVMGVKRVQAADCEVVRVRTSSGREFDLMIDGTRRLLCGWREPINGGDTAGDFITVTYDLIDQIVDESVFN